MRYWFYSEGNILGPCSPAELMAAPAFSPSSLVCSEIATGDTPGDWRCAERVDEIAELLTVGVGDIIPARAGTRGDAYEPGTVFSSGAAGYYETEDRTHYGYENLLNTIDNILGAYGEAGTLPQPEAAEPDYALIDRFDVRLSKIQEELEAARWEKNLLLERIRIKEHEDRKNKERIQELEERLRNVADKTELRDKETAQPGHIFDLKKKSVALEKIEEIKQESRQEQLIAAESRPEEEKRLQETKPEERRETAPGEPPETAPGAPQEAKEDFPRETEPAAQAEMKPEPLLKAGLEAPPKITPAGPAFVRPQPPPAEIKKVLESKPLKSIRPSHAVGLERTLESGAAAENDESNLTSRKLMSLGHSQLQSFGPDDFKAQPAPAFQEPLEPLPQQASGVVYDFTVVTKAADTEKFLFKIGTEAGAFSPALSPSLPPPVSSVAGLVPAQPQTPPVPGPVSAEISRPTLRLNAEAAAPAYLRTQPVLQEGPPAPVPPQDSGQAPIRQPSIPGTQPPAGLAPQTRPAPADAGNAPAADKTERIAVPTAHKEKKEALETRPAAGKSRSKLVFLLTLTAFGLLAAGGLGYFFLGGGTGLAEFSLLNFSGGKTPKKTSFSTQTGPKDEKAAEPESNAAAVPSAAPAADNAAADLAKPAAAAASNENIRKALDLVKNYRLTGGRGSMANWFANSFLSDSVQGSNEEWSATFLHGDIFVVQYRLLRPKHDPLIYQFEVDVAKALIVRGINNNAIELLDFSSKATARTETVRKTGATRRSRRPGAVPILPLPDASGDRQPFQEEPSGFENPAPDENEKVKYIKAQESDEELF